MRCLCPCSKSNQCLSHDLKIRIFYPCFKESQFNSDAGGLGGLHSLYSNFAMAMDELKSVFLGVQFKEKDQVFNILQEEGVSSDYKGILDPADLFYRSPRYR